MLIDGDALDQADQEGDSICLDICVRGKFPAIEGQVNLYTNIGDTWPREGLCSVQWCLKKGFGCILMHEGKVVAYASR